MPMEDHYLKLRAVMESAGRSVEQQLPSIAWHIEGEPTRHYLLSLMLVFVDPRKPEDELAVISVTCSRGPVLRWAIDATGANSILLAKETGLTNADHARLGDDPNAASAAVEAFVRRTERVVVESLTAAIG